MSYEATNAYKKNSNLELLIRLRRNITPNRKVIMNKLSAESISRFNLWKERVQLFVIGKKENTEVNYWNTFKKRLGKSFGIWQTLMDEQKPNHNKQRRRNWKWNNQQSALVLWFSQTMVWSFAFLFSYSKPKKVLRFPAHSD